MEELNWDNLPNCDWKVLESMMCLLEPFAQYTSLTSGDEYTTFSTIVPVLMVPFGSNERETRPKGDCLLTTKRTF